MQRRRPKVKVAAPNGVIRIGSKIKKRKVVPFSLCGKKPDRKNMRSLKAMGRKEVYSVIVAQNATSKRTREEIKKEMRKIVFVA